MTTARIGRARPWYAGLTRLHRATIIALLAALATATVALAYSLFRVLPFTGSIFNTGKVVLISAMTNDDGVEDMAGGFDQGDIASGFDPVGAAVLLPPWGTVARTTSNVQFCDATVNGETVDVEMSSTFDALTCAVLVRINNLSPRSMLYQGATVTGAPIDIVQDPYDGTLCANPGEQPSIGFELKPQAGAVPGTTWTGATAHIDMEWVDVASCP